MKAIGSGSPMKVPNASRMTESAVESSVSRRGRTMMSDLVVSSILDSGFIIAPLILKKQLQCATRRRVKQTWFRSSQHLQPSVGNAEAKQPTRLDFVELQNVLNCSRKSKA